MHRRGRHVLTAVVLVAGLLAMGAGFPSERVAPKSWAASVCTAVGGWVAGVQQGAQSLSTMATAPGNDVASVRDALAAYLGGTVDSTTDVLHDLRQAGKPATPKGSQAAAGLVAGFKKVRKALTRLERRAGEISTTDQAHALADLQSLQNKVGREFASLDDAFEHLDRLDPGHKLSRAFRATRACQALES